MSKIYRYRLLHPRMQVASSPCISSHHSLRPSKQWPLKIYPGKCNFAKFTASPLSNILIVNDGKESRSCLLACYATIEARKCPSGFSLLNLHIPKLRVEFRFPLQFKSKPPALSILAEDKFISINISDVKPTFVSGRTNVEVKKC